LPSLRQLPESFPHALRGRLIIGEASHYEAACGGTEGSSRDQQPLLYGLLQIDGANNASLAASAIGVTVEIPETSLLLRSDYARIASAPAARLAAVRSRLFRERGIQIHRLISRYLGLASAATTAASDYGRWFVRVGNFELVWEAIVRKLFSQGKHRSNFNVTAGSWIDAKSVEERTGIVPKTDVLFEWRRRRNGADEKYAVILDAKDKLVGDFGIRGTASDHYKQVVYREALVGAGKRVLNALIFPTLEGTSLDSGWFSVRGVHLWPEIAGSVVAEVTCDFRAAAEYYVGKRHLDADEALEAAADVTALAEHGTDG
jgi:hypothetical protein